MTGIISPLHPLRMLYNWYNGALKLKTYLVAYHPVTIVTNFITITLNRELISYKETVKAATLQLTIRVEHHLTDKDTIKKLPQNRKTLNMLGIEAGRYFTSGGNHI